MRIRILLADDHNVVREGLRSLIEKERDLEVVGEAENGRAAVRLTKKLSPDVVVMDIRMPDLNGVEATAQVVAEAAGARVVILSQYGDRGHVDDALRAGASGYVLKDCAFDELVRSIRTVAAGRAYLSPAISSVVIAPYAAHLPSGGASAYDILTHRELEVLQLVAEGKISKEIAARLGIKPSTVDMHRRHIMSKLAIHSVAELTKYAVREGLTSLED